VRLHAVVSPAQATATAGGRLAAGLAGRAHVIDIACVCLSFATGKSTSAVAGDQVVDQSLRRAVDGGAEVEQVPVDRIGHQPPPAGFAGHRVVRPRHKRVRAPDGGELRIDRDDRAPHRPSERRDGLPGARSITFASTAAISSAAKSATSPASTHACRKLSSPAVNKP
jgi:hypothetical protein